MFEQKHASVSVGGKEITFETGKIARQANGSVMLRCGDTMLLSTVCMSKSASDDIDFLPLRVDYFEKFSSTGKTLGGFIKREGRPTEKEILTCRLIDRPIRPMFVDGFYKELQLQATVLSFDGVTQTEPLAICAASAALVISDVPFIKPIGAVRVGFIDGDFVINPTYEDMEKSKLDLILAGTEDAILMIEGYCDFLSEEELLEAVEEGHTAIKKICQALLDFQKIAGVEKNMDGLRIIPEDLTQELTKLTSDKLTKALEISKKEEREIAFEEIKVEAMGALFPEGEESKFNPVDAKIAFKKISSRVLRDKILDTGKRPDGRTTEEVRPIDIDVSPLPRTHGSILFTRGETQAISVCTLGGKNAGQRYETLTEEGTRTFYLQYAFPPYSVGEVGRIGPPGRREVGHGKLAERALSATIPDQSDFPYTIRLEANITESNGSSSMASICGGCLSMMSAGVPVKKPIAGIAMGLILEENRFAVLSDILGLEDALGDMDFKIAGDTRGITAFQLDIKVEGISKEIMKTALAQAKEGRIHILNKMLEACPKVSDNLSEYAPRIETLQVKPSKIGILIGPGGKQIRAIVDETGVEIDIDDDGTVNISSTSSESMTKAKKIIHDLTADVEIGKTYKGKIVSVVAFGVFVAIFSKEGLCHISELAHKRIDKIEDHFKEGDFIDVKVIDINDRGQIKLSHKALLPVPEKSGK
ncbi:MAG: Polyribonucleotide nucleotidyltransferase [Chlamydiia bacterium]|nr:Polyribonucleotide nucleotidyltransferase [Chlamydiia bacterium]